MTDTANTPQWSLELVQQQLANALQSIQNGMDYTEDAREKLVNSVHPAVNLLPLAVTWTLPVSGAPTHYTFTPSSGDTVEITKLGTGPFGVMSVCDGLTVQASKEIVIASLEMSGTLRWWGYTNIRNATVSPGQIVRAGQPLGDVRMNLVLSGHYVNHFCERSTFSPLEFLGAHGVPGVG